MEEKTMGSSETISLPRDAEGREIPLDTKAMYIKYGKEYRHVYVLAWKYVPNVDPEIAWRAECKDYGNSRFPENMFLTPPDSWEKLLEDLDNASKGGDNAECLYMRRDVMEVQCPGCRLEDTESDDIECSYLVFADIAARIRKLRGEE